MFMFLFFAMIVAIVAGLQAGYVLGLPVGDVYRFGMLEFTVNNFDKGVAYVAVVLLVMVVSWSVGWDRGWRMGRDNTLAEMMAMHEDRKAIKYFLKQMGGHRG